MKGLTFLPIREDGSFEAAFSYDSEEVEMLSARYAVYYSEKGYHEPWTGYFAAFGDQLAGVCGFKGAPEQGAVEIAYMVFPRFEGKGLATAMTSRLVHIAKEADPALSVRARTLRERNASVRVLEKAGFSFHGEVLDPEDGEVWEWRCAEGAAKPG